LPEDFERVCPASEGRLASSAQNPTLAMSLERRQASSTSRGYGVWLIEDDLCAPCRPGPSAAAQLD
jgi:DNA-binding transcriptional MocR family regulator